MKIKVTFANYGENQLDYLHKSIDAFKSNNKHSIDIMVYSTVKLDLPHVLVPESIGEGLPFAPRREMASSVDDYDIFIYNENDMLITEDNIEAFLEHSNTLKDNEVSGFIRYELNSTLDKILLDPNPHWGKIISRRTDTVFEMYNKHQGCWILLQKDFKKALQSGGFSFEKHDKPYGPLEQGASDPYTQCGLKKVFPLDYNLCNRLLIHHMPNKYIKFSEWINCGISLKDLIDKNL